MADSVTSIDLTEDFSDALTRVLQPIETARGLANECYADASVYELERQRVFAGGWSCVGFAMDAPHAGDLHPFDFAGLPLLMARDNNLEVHLFHNVCPHRGRILVDSPQESRKAIVCPYHRWSYALDGNLIATPNVGGPGQHSCPDFNAGDIRLGEIRCVEWRGLVFADLSNGTEPFESYIAPVAGRWPFLADVPLVHSGADCTIEFTLDCNWKLAVENYCEAYHLPWVHPELNRYSPLDQHHAIVDDRYAGQQSALYDPKFPAGGEPFPTASGLEEFWETGAEYIALFPNALLGLHRDHYYAVLIQPDGSARTRERFEIFYFDEAVREEKFDTARQANQTLWRNVFAEDQSAVEGMQRGRSSPGYDGGVFSPVMDGPTHAFHKWIARALLHGR